MAVFIGDRQGIRLLFVLLNAEDEDDDYKIPVRKYILIARLLAMRYIQFLLNLDLYNTFILSHFNQCRDSIFLILRNHHIYSKKQIYSHS